jgi:glycosyltransferase involved in cell wall biosynthesis
MTRSSVDDQPKIRGERRVIAAAGSGTGAADMQRDAIDIVNLSELDPRWNWLASSPALPQNLNWSHSSSLAIAIPSWAPKPMALRRSIAALKAASLLQRPSSILVSHGPRMTMYGSLAVAASFRRRRHLAYSFNFTNLPQGLARKVMAASFRSVERFVCFSTMERDLYARHFDLDIERIDMIHWAAEPPRVDPQAKPAVGGEYICAIGSQARDYATLMRAMQALPGIRLVIIATPESVRGLSLPTNVEFRCNVPLDEAMNILAHCRFSVVPLRDTEVPCGHVTIVSAMHCKKATIVSDSSGVADYIRHEVNGLTVPVGNASALARAIDRLWSDPGEASRFAAEAKAFAQKACREQAASDYFDRFLRGACSKS